MVEVVCSRCKRQLREPTDLVRQPDGRWSVERFHAGAGLAVPVATVEEFLTPARAATVSADVVVPFLQALVTGLVASVVAVVPAVVWFGLQWYVVGLAGGLAWCMAWLFLLSEHRKSLWSHERYEREVEQPAPPPAERDRPHQVKVKLEVNERDGRMRFAHLPIDHERLRVMARALSNGRAFSVSVWSGGGNLLSRSEFETLRDWLLDSSYARWRDDNNRNLGVEFTRRGEALWRALAES